MKHIFTTLLLMGTTATATAQDISQIAKSDPLLISGSVGTRNTYYQSTGGSGYASPLSNSVYANLNISLFGFSMPFSLYYTNDNLAFNYPHLSFNMSPSYKNWRAHIGRSSMNYSPYVLTMSFNGVGLEYTGSKLRTGAFYGTLRSAVNDDPNMPNARRPQYKRLGWGFNVGYGSERNYADLYLLRAYDRPNSLDQRWHSVVNPQENLVVGFRGGLAIQSWLSFTANVAASAFSQDINAPLVENAQAQRYEDLFNVRYSSMMRFAGDANLNFTLPQVNLSLFYRMVQPDYTSLGAYYMTNNYHSLGINASGTLFNTLSLSATFSGQSDNLSKRQLYTTSGYVYALNASRRFGNHFNLSAGYNGYLQDQRDGTAHVNDTSRVHRIMHSLNAVPAVFFNSELMQHNISLSANWVKNKDLNILSTGVGDVQTLALGLNYDINIEPWDTDFNLSLSHQQSKSEASTYTSDIASVGVNRSFLKDRNLNISLTGTLCYNEVTMQSKSLSIGFDTSIGYTLKKMHVFSLSAGVNKYGDVNPSRTRSGLDATDISASLNYAYTFSILELKRKSNEKKL